jgi:hypothetical protein
MVIRAIDFFLHFCSSPRVHRHPPPPLTITVLPIMPGSTSNLSIDEQQATVAAAAATAKRKEEDAVTQAVVATAHWE